MRRLSYGMMVSLDGYIEAPGHDLGWLLVDEEVHRHANQGERETEMHLFGRRMWETMGGYWQSAEHDLSNTEWELEFARLFNARPTVVFSRTLEHVAGNARLVREGAVEEVARLKQEPGGDLTVAGAELAAAMLEADLVDAIQMYVNPVVLGQGTPMFRPSNRRLDLRLVDSRRFESGVEFLRYERR
jgi:dihydrofolate reductase